MVTQEQLDLFFAVVKEVMRNIHANTFAARDEFLKAAVERNAYNEWVQFRQIFY